MSTPIPSFANLTPYYNRGEVMRLTAQQIEKDFASAGIDFALQPEASQSFEVVHAQLLPEISRLMQHHFELLLSALYRIDVPEQQIAQASADGTPLPAAISTLIIHRELKKVLIRQWMKQQ